MVANALISRVTGLALHDYGCTLKAYDKEVIEHLELFGELHRFIPALALISGAKVIEIPVNHRARERGSSKYGISRMPRVVLDLLTVKFLIGYRQKPMQFFGRVALVCVGAAGLSALWSLSRLLRGRPLRSGVLDHLRPGGAAVRLVRADRRAADPALLQGLGPPAVRGPQCHRGRRVLTDGETPEARRRPGRPRRIADR